MVRSALLLLTIGLGAIPQATLLANTQEGAAIIRFVPGRAASQGNTDLRIASVEVNGRIAPDSHVKLREALDLAFKTPTLFHASGAPMVPVRLNSPGGDIVAAMKMGEIIRQVGASTWVGPRSVCASACILILAGGIERSMFDDATLGLHRPYMPPERFAAFSRSQASETYKAMEAAVSEYLQSMGVSQRLFERMLTVPSTKIEWISEEDAKQLRLLGTDPAFYEWNRARAQQRYVPGYVDWLDKLNDCSTTLDECLRRNPLPQRPR